MKMFILKLVKKVACKIAVTTAKSSDCVIWYQEREPKNMSEYISKYAK